MSSVKRKLSPRRKSAKRPATGSRARRRKPSLTAPRQLERALASLAAAVRATTSRAETLLSASHAIAELAAAGLRDCQVKDLIDAGALRALDRMIAGDAPANVVTAREVLMGWLRRNLEIETMYDPGQTLDLPARALAQMEVEGPPVADNARLVSVRVVGAGWKARGKVIVRPTVEIVMAEAMSSSARR